MSPLSNRSAMASVMLFAATVATGLCFINNQSFWMDEGNAIVKAIMPTPAMMLDLAEHMRGSEIQMPLFMLALWAWEKIVGHAEYALRLINLPFLVVAVFALRRMPFWPLACLTSPFVLYYSGELRPYMLQIAGAATGLAALSQIAQDQKAGETKGLHTLLGSCIFLAASSLTAAVWSLGLVIGMLMMRPDWPMQKVFWRKAGIWFPLALAIAGYHTFMLVEGYRGAVARGGGLLSMGFGVYELAGMMGLGPERDAIRGFPLPRFLKEHPWLPAYAALFAVAWLAGVREWLGDKPIRIRIGMAAAAGTPVLMLAAISMIADFSVLGRHMSPLLPWLLVPLGWFYRISLHNKSWLAVAVPLLIGAIVSAITLRTAERHGRDDYRQATALVVQDLELGRTVQWNADMNTPRFYAYRKGGMALVNAIQIMESEKPETLFTVDVIYINRPDLRYPGLEHGRIFSEQGFLLDEKLNGFEIWRSKYNR